MGAPAEGASHDHASHGAPPPSWKLTSLSEGAVLLGNLGNVHRKVTTTNSQAQAYFDQGLALTYGFNHDEAARSFAKAGALDPTCALCFWGAAYTLGPNYNIPMLPDRAQAAWDALQRARAAAGAASPAEHDLIEALSKRYKGPEYLEPPAMQPYVEAYAAAMRTVAQAHPDDLDVQVLYAEAQMNVNPWRLYALDGTPAPGTLDAVHTLESVLAAAPEHAGANHYYIHAVEASREPGKALPSARRLGGLVPGAGHLVHMPAHIFQRVGAYAEASDANRRAIVADQAYLARVQPPGYYPFYLGHNYGFLAYSTSMEGKSRESLEAARKSAASAPKDIVCGMPGMDFFLSEPLLVMVRFGKWAELMQEPEPDAKYPVLVALYHHAQGMALAAQGRGAEASARVAKIRAIAQGLPPGLVTGLNDGRALLEMAALVVEARTAEATRAPDAVEAWRRVVAAEDQLAYSEPADWFYPTRHYLGALLLDLGRAEEAERVYRDDLQRNPENGWAYFGLWKSLEAQHRSKPAKEARANFERTFAGADFALERTAF